MLISAAFFFRLPPFWWLPQPLRPATYRSSLGVTYRAVLRPSPGCAASAVLRVRKSSTLNTVRGGARYQPIKPAAGACDASALTVRKPVPGYELWTLDNWRWEYWAAAKSRWVAGEVLRAAP